MKISYSRLNYYQTCPRLYYWRFVRNLIPTKTPLPLIVGKAVHAGLASHYAKEGNPLEHAHESFVEAKEEVAWLKEEMEGLATQEKYVDYILEQYIQHWADEPWTMLAPEVEGHIELGEHLFFFRLDGLISWKGRPWLLEHKTTSQLGPSFFNRFRNDGQITGYCYGAWKKLGHRPVGALINAIRKTRNLEGVEFARDVVMRSERQLEDYMIQVALQCADIERIVKEEAYEGGDLRAWYMHTGSCNNWNRQCDFTELCYSFKPGLLELFRQRPEDYVDKGGKQDE